MVGAYTQDPQLCALDGGQSDEVRAKAFQMAMLSWIGALLETALPVKVATTADERQGIAQMRYQVYVEEQKDRHPDADHEARTIWSTDDEDPNTLLFYVGPSDRPLGTLKVRVWAPGSVPAELYAFYSMDKLPDIDCRVTCDVTALMFRAGARGTAAVPGLTSAAARHVVSKHGVELMFASCSPGHLPAYRRLGLRTFGGALINDSFSMLIPLVGIVTDVEHLRQCDSPWYPSFRKLQRKGMLPKADLTAYINRVETYHTVVTGPTEIASELAELGNAAPTGFLERFSPKAQKCLSQGGFIIDVEPDTWVVRAGSSEQEMFLILQGVFEVRTPTRRVTLTQGDLFGELAFFGKSGLRSADVVTVTPGRMLVLRRKFLAGLRKNDPEVALDIYEAIASLMARRLSTV